LNFKLGCFCCSYNHNRLHSDRLRTYLHLNVLDFMRAYSPKVLHPGYQVCRNQPRAVVGSGEDQVVVQICKDSLGFKRLLFKKYLNNFFVCHTSFKNRIHWPNKSIFSKVQHERLRAISKQQRADL
jgi:hypothetical protein